MIGASGGYIRHLICRVLPQSVSVVAPLFDERVLKVKRIESDGAAVMPIPVGNYKVVIKNVGPVNGGAVAKIQINHGGDDPIILEVDAEPIVFEEKYIDAKRTVVRIQSIEIITNGATVHVDCSNYE